MSEDGGGGEKKRLPENPVILENAPRYFTVWFICSFDSNVNNGQSRFTQNLGRNLGLIQGVRLMYLKLIQVTFVSRITKKPIE